MLLTWNNLAYYQELMAGLRKAIADGRLADHIAEVKEGWAKGERDGEGLRRIARRQSVTSPRIEHAIEAVRRIAPARARGVRGPSIDPRRDRRRGSAAGPSNWNPPCVTGERKRKSTNGGAVPPRRWRRSAPCIPLRRGDSGEPAGASESRVNGRRRSAITAVVARMRASRRRRASRAPESATGPLRSPTARRRDVRLRPRHCAADVVARAVEVVERIVRHEDLVAVAADTLAASDPSRLRTSGRRSRGVVRLRSLRQIVRGGSSS